LLGVTSMSISTAELKASANMQTYNLASDAAETAMNIVLAPDFPPTIIDWTLTGTQTVTHSQYFDTTIENVTGGTLNVDLTVTYTDCSKVPVGFSITEGGQDGGTMFNGMVHDLSASPSVVSTMGADVASAKRLRGIQTMVVSCE